MRNHAVRSIVFLLFALLLTVLAGCSASQRVEIPILAQQLPPKAVDAPVEFYWSPKSLEGWLQLAVNPDKAPDLAADHLTDTHTLWENRSDELPHSKVADVVVSGQISLKHPREWLLADLGKSVRELGADAAVVNSYRVSGLTGHRARDDNDALWTDGTVMKVWLYAQAVRYE